MGISADALLCDDKVSIKDIELLKKFEVIQEMTSDDKSIVLKFLDLVIRDTKAKKSLCFLILLHKNCFLEWFFFDNTTRCNRAVAGGAGTKLYIYIYIYIYIINYKNVLHST